MPTAERLIDAYVKIRDAKKALQDKHKEQLAPYNEKLIQIEMILLDELNSEGAQSIKTPAGTAYKKVNSSVNIEDWEAALDYVLANNLTHMLEKRLAKSSVEEFVEANDSTPPGVSITRELSIGIRRS